MDIDIIEQKIASIESEMLLPITKETRDILSREQKVLFDLHKEKPDNLKCDKGD